MKNRLVSEELFQKIMNVMAELPAGKVYDLITQMLQSKVHEEIPMTPKAEEAKA